MATMTEKQFQQLLTTLTDAVKEMAQQQQPQPAATAEPTKTFDVLASRMDQFSYDPEGDLTFEAWYLRHEDIFREDAKTFSESTRVRLLLHKLDASAYEKYASYILPKTPRDITFVEAVSTLKDLFGPQASLFSRRYACMKLAKDPREDFITYAGRVNRDCAKFKLTECDDNQFKCLIFVSGLQSSEDAFIRLKLLDKIEADPKCTVQSLTEECKRLTNLKQDTKMVEDGSSKVHAVRHEPTKRQEQQYQLAKRSQAISDKMENRSTLSSKRPPSPCWLCGAMHFVRNCAYRRHKCSECRRIGHKEGFCNAGKRPSRPVRSSQHSRKPTARSDAVFTVSNSDNNYRRYATLTVDGKLIHFQVDSAADITIINESTWKSMGSPPLQSPSLIAHSASGDRIQFLGQRNCTYNFHTTSAQGIYFVGRTMPNLLGAEWISNMGLYTIMDKLPRVHPETATEINVNSTMSSNEQMAQELQVTFPEVFNSHLGLYRLSKATLRLKKDAKPIFRPKRPVPYAALPAVDNEIDRLEANGVISKINYSEWAAPIVIVKKANGSLRICADFSTGLNDALDLHQYPLPLPEEIFATLAGGQYFSHIDFADAYLQIEMDEDSKRLLTINTHRGLYQYNRLPFGVKSAPAIFQQIMDATLAGLQGVVAYLDDVIVVGRTEEEHKRNLQALFKRIAESGFHVRLEKCHFATSRINYLGYIIDKHGRRPDPKKIDAITKMPAPKDISQLRSFLGLLSYYGSFVKEIRSLRAPLDSLLAKNAKFHWTKACEDSFNRAKAILSSDLLLAHYDPSQEIIVAADASNYGLGAVISHRYKDGSEKAVAHASRSLLPAEKYYSQVEKEGLALIFAVQKFHRMLHGRHFTLLTDHKPLLTIFGSKKGIPVYTANRLQRWATILLAYDFNIQYRSTGAFGQADALSRLIANHSTPEEDRVIAAISVEDDITHTFANAVRALPVTAEEIKKSSAEDRILQQVNSYLRGTWPAKITDPELSCFYNRRTALSTLDGCLLLADRVVIPAELQPRVLRQLHNGHPGIVRMKALARSYVYWPRIDKDIEDTVKRCTRCSSVAKLPIKTTLAAWPQPDAPWTRIHIDYAGPFAGTYFLVIVDAFSKWPEILMTNHTTTKATISLLQQIFARYGIPETLVSDNGTQFTSDEFKRFCTDHGIEQLFSPPYHPQSNGQAERFVDTFKRTMSKLKGEGTVPEILQTFLLTYRSTPSSTLDGMKSPAELFIGRKLRTVLSLLKPTPQRVQTRNTQMESQFNKQHGARKRVFQPGDPVLVRQYSGNQSEWHSGKVLQRVGRVIYKVLLGNRVCVRHANQLRLRYHDTPPHNIDKDMDMLFDAFGLQTPTSVPTTTTLVRSNDITTTMTNEDRSRRSTRMRLPSSRLQVDPHKKTYYIRDTR